MTKKHFEIVARAIADSAEETRTVGELQAVRKVAQNLSEEFAKLNPRFNKRRFLDACGFDYIAA